MDWLVALMLTLTGVSLTGVRASGTDAQILTLLPLGDSITRGTGDADVFGYRNHLQDELGVGVYRLVGNQQNPSSDATYYVNHAGVAGETTAQIESRTAAALTTFMSAGINSGSAVLIHAGTNDVTNGVTLTDARDNVEDIIDLIHAHNPSIAVYVALIIPKTGFTSEVATYNDLLVLLVENYGKSNLYMVDMENAFLNDTTGLCSGDWAANCMDDTTHPNNTGYRVMAKIWASAIEAN